MPDSESETSNKVTRGKKESSSSIARIFRLFYEASLASMVETAVTHPLLVQRLRYQMNLPFTLHPRELCRGTLADVLCSIPATVMQVSLNVGLRNILSSKGELTAWQQVMSAFFSGAAATLVNCPMEMIVTYQRITQSGFIASGEMLIEKRGLASLASGGGAMLVRDGIYGVGLLAVAPMLNERIRVHTHNDFAATAGAGLIAGFGATIVSQCADTIKVKQQSAGQKETLNLIPAIQAIYKRSGVLGFFRGVVLRGIQVVPSIGVASTVLAYVSRSRLDA